MVDTIIAFSLGLFVGAFIGTLLIACLVAGSRSDEYSVKNIDKAKEENAE